MENIIVYAVLLFWCFGSMGFGIIEGNLFHKRPHISQIFKAKFRVDIHVLFTLIRVLVAAPLLYGIWKGVDIIEATYALGFMVFVFPFLHDGAYYHTRRDLSNGKTYPRGWWDRSTTTSAIFSFNWYVRTVLFVIAIIFFLPY